MPATTSFDATRFPRKLNLGCGSDRREGYLNVDLNEFNKPDLLADVADLSALPDGYYEEVLAQDVLEHLPRTSTSAALREWNRLLRMGGLLRVRVPSLEGLWAMFERSSGFAEQVRLVQNLFGTQAYTGDFHFTTFTRVLLEGYLDRAGFRVKTRDMLDGWLFEWTAKKHREAPPPKSVEITRLLAIAQDDEFVRAVYRVLLRREPDAGGFEYYRDNLRQAHFTRQQIIDVVLGSPEYQQLAPLDDT